MEVEGVRLMRLFIIVMLRLFSIFVFINKMI